MKITFIVNNFPKYSETFIINQVAKISLEGHEVTVLTNNKNVIDSWQKNLIKDLQKVKITSSIQSQNKFFGVFSTFVLLVKGIPTSLVLIKQVINEYGVTRRALKAYIYALPLVVNRQDIIHFEYSGLAIFYKDAIPLIKPTKLIMSCRGNSEQIRPFIDSKRKQDLIMISQYMDRIHCVSKKMIEILSSMGMPQDKMFVNYPSIDPQIFKRQKPYPQGDNQLLHIVSISRMRWEKGLEIGIESMRFLKEQGFDFIYYIVGDGPDEEKLQFEIHDLDLDNYIILLGKQNPKQIISILENVDIFLLPSLSEGISNAVLEAMAMELPIVSTDVGGMSEAIEDGVNGLLCFPRNPEDMANKLINLINKGSLSRQKMGIIGRQLLIQKFNLNDQIEIFSKEYSMLLNPNA